MSVQPIHVIMRMCPDSAEPICGGGRPEWFSKEKVFQNLLVTKDDNTIITVLFDGDINQHWINKYPVNLIEIHGRSGDASFLIQLQYTLQNTCSDDDIIYILEDDYVHRPGWPSILREAFDGSILPNFIKIDYATLYDHRDKYFYDMYNTLVSKIMYTPSVHWRTVPSTTNTFAMTYKVFKEDYDVHFEFMNRDNDKFLTLGQLKGRIIASCMPGYSTHCHPNYLSPCVNWKELVEKK